MEKRIYHGSLTPADFGRALMAEFNQGNLRTQLLGEEDHLIVQIATTPLRRSGGSTALTVYLQKVEDGAMVTVGQQDWLGVAASLGETAFSALMNPINLLGRLDDLAQDILSLQLSERVWGVVERIAQAANAGYQLSERLSRLKCEYCGVANPFGEPTCIACGAPLGAAQPRACRYCGYVLSGAEKYCPNCGRARD